MTQPQTPRPKPKAALARRQILEQAARMMRRSGYAQMSLRDLADDVGMKAGSLYYHFPSKDALATEVMQQGVQMVQQAVEAALAAQPGAAPRARLMIALEVHLETLLSASDFTSAHIRCYPFVPQNVRTELTAARRSYDRDWEALIAAYLGAPPTSDAVRHLRHALLGALNWSLEWFDPERDSAGAYIATLGAMVPPR